MRQFGDVDNISPRDSLTRWISDLVEKTFGHSNFRGRGRRLRDGYSSLV
jgi:hypothetical protein